MTRSAPDHPVSEKSCEVARSFEITRVRTARPSGAMHEHVDAVELDSNPNRRFAREAIVRDLKTVDGYRYYTYASGARAEVIVARCPHCGERDYITTAPDSIRANDLLSLPRF